MLHRGLRSVALLAAALLSLGAGLAGAQANDEIDWTRAKEIRQRIVSGEKVSPEERAYFERAKQLRQRTERGGPAAGKPPVGLKPLSDMTAEERYKGQDGGLYGGGKNEPPAKHRDAAMREARLIRPVDAEGQPAKSGQIGLVSIGMSNTTQEFSDFMRLAGEERQKSPSVALVDGAQGGMEAQAWAEMDRPWDALDQRLQRAGITPPQVQVVWMKQARRSPASLGEFPKHADELTDRLVVILHKLHERFPNLRIAYLSSRIYAGYARSNLNPEPYAYESAFAVRTLIRRQIDGEPSLSFAAAQGKVLSPLLLWGPYLWADGEQGRKFDDLVWKPEDLGPDGTHPSPSGRNKVAEQLLRFFQTDPTAKEWFMPLGKQ